MGTERWAAALVLAWVGLLPATERTGTLALDQAEMAVIAAGPFVRGTPQGLGDSDEGPQRTLYLDAFRLDREEVTNRRYRVFLLATGHRVPEHGASYWAGRELSSAEEATAWWTEEGAPLLAQKGRQGIVTTTEQSLPQGRTPEAVLQMAGNVWEWVADWYDPAYYAVAPERNPPGPASGEYKVLRGGSWLNHHGFLRGAVRDGSRSTMRNHGTGFRCAQDIGKNVEQVIP